VPVGPGPLGQRKEMGRFLVAAGLQLSSHEMKEYVDFLLFLHLVGLSVFQDVLAPHEGLEGVEEAVLAVIELLLGTYLDESTSEGGSELPGGFRSFG